MTGNDARRRGEAAEQEACRYLLTHGLQLITRNFRCRRGEIDLVMQDRGCLVFVEVRFRRSPGYGGALESVTPDKQRRIITAASHFLQTRRKWSGHACRFDVVGITGPEPAEVHWIKDAFSSG